ncbi:MAG: TolB family protein [Anaerolineae bacterium]|nr:TolB family protein [Anaerolineae bacterium]
MEQDSFFKNSVTKVIRWLLKPQRVSLPPLVWGAIIAGIVSLMLWAVYAGPTIPSTEGPEISVSLPPTPTPPFREPPGPPATPVGSGGTLAFTMRHNGNSDIYLLSQQSGDLIRLTFDAAEDRDPAWSPDGQWLAFASHRARNWDLYLMDMNSGTVLRLTDDMAYEAGPTWSPDGKWLAYEAYYKGNLDIYIINVESEDSIQLTHDPEPEYAPTWAPDGRHIVYTTYRDYNKDLYLIALDNSTTINLTQTPQRNEDYAAWSPDGAYLIYSAGVPGDETIWRIPFDKDEITLGAVRPMIVGIGAEPIWSPDGEAMAFIFRQQTTSYLIAAATTGWGLAQESYSTQDWMGQPDWTATPLGPTLEARLKLKTTAMESPLYTELLLSENPTHYRLVNLPGVNNSDTAEKLSDRVNDSYNALRAQVEQKTGWDYLAILGDSWRTMNYTPRPGQGRISWHVCGRAVDINQGYLSRGLIELVREDIGGVTYWRVFIKASEQDGSLGEPLRTSPWDLSARSDGELATAQGGELKAEVPGGYYVDFTTIAADYGWERRNALSNWRSSYYDIEWWHFQKTEGMSWYDCMLELYPEQEITESYGILPWWTKRPEWEVQAMP